MKQLIVTGDDFGRSSAVNEAIERCHEAGFLTQASLMVNEPGAEEAARIARRHPRLCIGLHLTLCDGRASAVSPLTDARGKFVRSPARAGLRYFLRRRLAGPLGAEIRAQFERFRAMGFAPSYWDGHTHLHLHPTILRLTLPVASGHGFRAVRLVREPGPLAAVPLIFQALSRAAIPGLKHAGVHFADRVFGLRETGRMTTDSISRILENLPDGSSELYFHPGAEPALPDFSALAAILDRRGIILRNSLPPPAAR